MYLPAPDEAIWVGTLRLVVRVPGSRSLKDKRRAILSLRDRLIARHHAAVAEVGHLDNHDLSVMAVGVVGNDGRVVRSRLDTIRAEADGRGDVVVIDARIEIRSFDAEVLSAGD